MLQPFWPGGNNLKFDVYKPMVGIYNVIIEL